jgi:hypothetical protein
MDFIAMIENKKKLQLGENHRRVVSVLIRRIEATCEGVLHNLDRRSSLLHNVEEDLTPQQDQRLRELVGNLRSEIERVESEVTLDPVVSSRRRSIAALVSSAVIDLQEVCDSALRGYGSMPEAVERALVEKLASLMVVLEEMERIAESKDAHS